MLLIVSPFTESETSDRLDDIGFHPLTLFPEVFDLLLRVGDLAAVPLVLMLFNWPYVMTLPGGMKRR
jgi:hypothetical protein